MLIMNLDKISRYYGVRAIFTDLSWAIGEGEKIGLVGPNGAGKSSLLRLLAGIDQPDDGVVVPRKGTRVAYLPQEVQVVDGDTPLSVALAAKPELARIAAAIEQAEAAFADPDIYSDMSRLTQLSEHHSRLLEDYEAGGGPRLLNLASGLLRDLGFSEDELQQPLATMSGGQKKLAHIARCILGEPDLLLLDEPDNHLDLARKARLEAVIRDFPGTVIVISHDRYLLDETVTQIAELEDGKLKTYSGDYSSYAVQKQLAQAIAMEQYQNQQKEITRLETVVQRFRDWAARTQDKERLIKQARATQKRIDRIEQVDKPVLERRRMGLELRAGGRGGQKVVELRGLSKSFSANGHGENIVLRDLRGLVRNGERVGVVGANGAGKSVLFRLISGALEPSGGAVWVGPSINMGMYTQEHQSLDMGSTLVDTIRNLKPMYEGQAYAFLGRFMFGYEQANRLVSTLSGGEKARLQLACLMLGTANCLLLDEPTNNLDIQSAEVLERALDDYPGSVIVISHDRYFLDRVVDRIWELRDGHLREFEGGWSDYADFRR